MNATPAGRKIALDVCNRGEPKVQIENYYFQIEPLGVEKGQDGTKQEHNVTRLV
jgi:hypothetical protein